MRLLLTLLMLILVALGVAWLTAGDRLGLTPPRPAPDAADPAIDALTQLRPEKVRKIDLTPPGQPTVSLTRNPDGTWSQPGNWPVRASEATALLNALTGLRTRFHPVKASDADLSKYGLAADQKPAVAVVQLDGKSTTLRFGQPPADATDAGLSRPTYVRVDEQGEVVRLGPDVWPVLTRPADAYRRRQLFPDADRVKLTGGEPPTDPTRPTPPAAGRVALLGDKYESVRVESFVEPKGAVTFRRVAPTPETRRDPDRPAAEAGLTADRLAGAWELDAQAADGKATVRDKVAPAKLRAALTAVPDLWVEKFVDGKSPAETGLDKPDHALTVTRPGGQAVTVRFGKVARSVSKIEDQPPPSPFAPPPPPPKVTTEEYRYAKLDNNPLVFEVRTDKLKDLFADADSFRDPQLARFEPGEATEVVVAVKGKPPVKLIKKKGNKDAERDDDRQDRWYVGDVLAESSKVTELLDQLSRLEAKGKDDRVDNPDAAKLKDLGFDAQRTSDLSLVVGLLDRLEHHGRPAKESGGGAPTLERLKALGIDLKEFSLSAGGDPIAQLFAEVDRESKLWGRLKDQLRAKRDELAAGPDATTVTVTAQAKAVEGETPPQARTFTFVLGKDDADKKKLAVLVAGWPRVNLVDDAVVKNVDRPALAYRGRRLFDTAEAKLTSVGVARPAGEGFALVKDDAKWKLTKPVTADADESKASQLTNDLSRLEASEYVDDAPKPEDLEKKYGLTAPRFTVDLGFTGSGAKPQVMQIGSAREGKSEAFARLNNAGSVFAVPKATVDSLETGALGLLPLQLWSVPSDKLTGLEVRRSETNGNESYRIVKEAGNWKLTGPFDAAVGFVDLQPLLVAAAGVKAEKYEATTAVDPAKYGFDKPALRLAVMYMDGKPEAPVTRTLVVGKPTDGAAGRFARVDGGPTPAVFVLPDSIVKEADKPALGWLDKSLLALDPAKVTKVHITGQTPDEAVTLVRDGAGWKADGAAFAVDKPIAEALVMTASRPPIVRLVGYGDAVKWADYGLDKPTTTVTLTADKTHKIELGKAEPSGERYVRIDGGPAVGVLLPRAAESLARGKLDFVDRSMLAFDPQGLSAVTRVAGKDELELTQAGIGWEIAKPAKQKADAATLEDLADQLSRLRATKVAAYAPADADLPKYGLAEPAATLTLKVGDQNKVLKVGGPVDAAEPDGDRYAVAVPADPKAAVTVGVLPAALANRLLAPPLKFRDKALAKFVDAEKITLARGDRNVTFAKVDGTWKVTEPAKADAEQTDLDEFVNAAAKLRADELEADKPDDLKPFGLDKPEATWTFFAGDKEVLKLLIGAKTADGRAHAKTAGGELVARLDPGLTAKVMGEYRKRQVWPDVDASQAEGLILGGDGLTNTVLRKEGAGWVDTAKPGEPIDAAKVTDTLAALAGLKAERYVADADAKLELYGLAKPSRVMVVTLRDNATRTLHIGGPVGGSGGKQVYAKAGESGRGEVFVLSEADTIRLTRDRAAYAGKK